MAWGCFCWIPCPYKKWNEEDRTAMIAMLPLLGTFLGLMTWIIWGFLYPVGETTRLLTAAATVTAYLLLTGFIHLDGFMDCCDALMPRHPEMSKRIEILKDPHTGAFAVISLGLVLIIMTASVADLSEKDPLSLAAVFCMITTISRASSALDVLLCRPMDSSQYTAMAKGKRPAASIVIVIATAVLVTAGGILLLIFECGAGFHWKVGTDVPSIYNIAYSITFMLLFSRSAGGYARKKLGGMNGDISGQMIVLSETLGLLFMAMGD